MRLRKVTGLLLTAVCAASFLCPAAWAANAHPVEVETVVKNGEVELRYFLGDESAIEDPAKINEEFRQQIKAAVDPARGGMAFMDAPERTETETMLGMQFASSTALDAIPKQDGITDWIVSDSKIDEIAYYQRRRDGDKWVILKADINYNKSLIGHYGGNSQNGASIEKTDYTTPSEENYQIWSVKNEEGKIIGQYVLFRYGKVYYTLSASDSKNGLAQEYLYPILDSMTFPEGE